MIPTRLNVCWPDLTEFAPLRCSIDPISAAVGGIATGVMGLMGGGGGGEAAATPAAPPPQAPAQKTPEKKPQTQSTFVGGVPAPPPSTGQKTLLGS
jgi:hypothetical protein